MKSDDLPEPMQPVAERTMTLDALRGAALFGVLLVNLESDFRASLFQQMLTPHLHAGWLNYATDLIVAGVFEFKAFTLFAFLFGVGVGIQTGRAAANIASFLVKRFTVLLVIGLCHMLLIWNGDILTLYAVCGLLLIPLVKLPARWLAASGIALILLSPYLTVFWVFSPPPPLVIAHAAIATRVYAAGGFEEIMALRWHEAWRFIAPLLIGSLPRTFGLMLCGVAAWRGGVLIDSLKQRGWLKRFCLITGSLGVVTTAAQLWAKETAHPMPSVLNWIAPYDTVWLAGAYGAGLWLWLSRTHSRSARWLAAGGRLALSNYLMQSVLFSMLFYGFGFGLFGQVGSAAAALLGCVVFAAQLVTSVFWLRRYQFGPMEWLWRSLTYGRRQPLRPTSRA